MQPSTDEETQVDLSTFMLRGSWCVFYGSGIIASLVIYGMLQERIMTYEYGNELFSYSVFLVFLNRIAAVIFAIVMALVYKEGLMQKAPLWKYLIISLSNV